jgi:DNA-binding protein Fis
MHTHTDSARGPAANATNDEGDLIDWRLEMMTRWQALGLELFGIDGEDKARLSELLEECGELIVVWVLVQTHGNVTQAALWLRATRRRLRRYLAGWRKRHPRLVPPLRDHRMRKPRGDRA